MSFLDKSQAIFVDAVLTDRGRQLLSEGVPIKITKFALSDDGIDYSMFNVTDTRGPDYYDASILAQPVLETLTRTAAASEDGRSSVMKTMLTSEINVSRFEQEISGLPEIIDLEGALDMVTLSPETLNLGSNETYTITLSDSTFIEMFVEGDTIEEPFVTTGITSSVVDDFQEKTSTSPSNVAAKERARQAAQAARNRKRKANR